VAVLAVATESGGVPPGGRELHALDATGLDELASRAGAAVELVTADASDVRRVLKQVDTHLSAVLGEDTEGRWRDEGWWLVWPAAALVLLWFRRGWLVEWER
jgi:Ca-activated chloride channel family protein